jgi:hypothetical protein
LKFFGIFRIDLGEVQASMPHPFFLSYSRKDSVKIDGTPDPHFTEFVARLQQRVSHWTAGLGFIDDPSIEPGQIWSDELADALCTANTMICLYSPSYFMSEYCGKEMQIFLDRRQTYMRTHAGKSPANIIPVVWQAVPWRIPTTLPDIQYADANLDVNRQGVWDLGDQGQNSDLIKIADQTARRVREAADLTPLTALTTRPSLNAVRSAFLPPPLPLIEFDSAGASAGPNAATFVYASTASTAHWHQWPWAPPENQAVLYLAAAVAKGREMDSTQMVFNLADTTLNDRLSRLKQSNNVVVLFVDAGCLEKIDALRARLRDFDASAHASFAIIIMMNDGRDGDLRTAIEEGLPYFSRRAPPYFQVFETKEGFNFETRDNFSKTVSKTLSEIKLAVLRDSQSSEPVNQSTEYRVLPTVVGPGQSQVTA